MDYRTKNDARKSVSHLFKEEDFWKSETDTLSFRLRGIYPLGPRQNGEPEFGWQHIDRTRPLICLEAAHRIDELEAEVQELLAKLNEFEEFEGLDLTM